MVVRYHRSWSCPLRSHQAKFHTSKMLEIWYPARVRHHDLDQRASSADCNGCAELLWMFNISYNLYRHRDVFVGHFLGAGKSAAWRTTWRTNIFYYRNFYILSCILVLLIISIITYLLLFEINMHVVSFVKIINLISSRLVLLFKFFEILMHYSVSTFLGYCL